MTARREPSSVAPPEPAGGAWRAQSTEDGSWTLVHPVHGEACHSLAGAWTQARQRYASILADLPDAAVANGSVRLLDIGTGLGLNLAAAVEACDARGLRLEAWSFEIDSRVIRTALEEARVRGTSSEPHARVLAALAEALDANDAPAGPRVHGIPGAGAHRLRLVLGDARAALVELPREVRFDAVFLDPFSPRVDPPLWDGAFLAEVAARMAPLARLSTYTAAMRVRASLAGAGLAVGLGPRVGRKAAGTLASRGGVVPPLPPRIERRLERARAALRGAR